MPKLGKGCGWAAACLLALLCAISARAEGELTQDEFFVAQDEGIQLYVRNKRPAQMKDFRAERTLLYVHGATYPAETAFDLALDGYSWMDFIARQGWDVYLMDVRGYGRSTRPKEMDLPAETNPPIVRGDVAVRDIGTVVDHLLARRNLSKLCLMGWSWGTVTMGAYAAQNTDKAHKLVLYAPLWLRPAPPGGHKDKLGAYRSVNVDAARKRWLNGVPESERAGVLPDAWFDAWAKATWATDERGAQQNPPVVRAPNGVIADVREFWEQGKPTYDPAAIRAPVLLIHAEWDADTPAAMSQALFPLLVNAPIKRYVVIGEGTHQVLMEKNRLQLFREVQMFLEE